MKTSRRQFSFLLPALAASAAAQEQKQPAAPLETMTSKIYDSTKIPYTGDETKKARNFFLLATHAGFKVQMHETDLGPGVESHPPHKHIHEEIMVVTEGELEAIMEGVPHVAPTGSVIVFGSNLMHGVRNPGAKPAKYYVIELRADEA